MSRSRTPLLNIPIEFEPPVEDIRVVVGIDFGTTFSGFSYAFIKPENEKTDIVVNDNWPGIKGPAKINTVLQYDEDYEDIITWGAKALAIEPSRRDRNNKQPPKPIELFKFHLGNVIQQEIKRCWPDIDFYRHVRIVVTVPAGFTEDTKTTMRKCLYDAGLIKRIGTLSLQFTTEPEAAAIYCMSTLEEHGLTIGAKYLIVDCGGGTVDLTVRKVKQNFESQIKIAVPPRPVIAVVNGACEYGLNMKSISTRVLKWTYGVEIAPKWQASDPPDRKMSNGRIKKFSLMVKKGTEVNATDEYSQSFSPPEPDATTLKFTIYYTSKDDATYCDEPEMNLLGSFNINLPDAHLGMNRPVLLTLCFGSMEIVAAAKNQTTGEDYRTTFSSAEI
ncbi:unnamed protein product [Rhizophagus irregularis]|uniref:Actin-like ATPase domain-containing protein n=1 Tax=Rhizophagus irregularis TaxID=588596 RepID=A0A915YY35_9GLOM|nr:unnamed protein product [Rhizophagus irregularis]